MIWNSRFSSRSGDSFDNHAGFEFPPPEVMTLAAEPHLLVAQAFIPPTERTRAAGFELAGENNAIRAEVVRRVDRVTDYRRLFAKRFPSVRTGAPIDYDTLAAAIRHDVNASASLLDYSARERLPTDLSGPIAPTAPLLAAIDHRPHHTCRAHRRGIR